MGTSREDNLRDGRNTQQGRVAPQGTRSRNGKGARFWITPCTTVVMASDRKTDHGQVELLLIEGGRVEKTKAFLVKQQ